MLAKKDDVFPHVPTDKPILKSALREECNRAGIALNKVYGFIGELVQEGKLFELQRQRSGTGPQKWISRTEKPPADWNEPEAHTKT